MNALLMLAFLHRTLGVESVEFRLTVQYGEIRITSSPRRILETGFPGLANRRQRFRFVFQDTEDASGVVEDHRVIRSKRGSEVGFLGRIIIASNRCIRHGKVSA